MANIMLTKQCNLHCPYCFANEFVNKQSDVMSFDHFQFCLRFLSSNPRERIGLIGGEPTTHPDFKRMLAALIDSPFSSVCLFTNGILLDRYYNELRNTKFQILVNLNSPEAIGQELYQRTIANLDEMVQHLYMHNQLGLSLNIHSADQDFSYILEALKRYSFQKLRLSIAVPNLDENRRIDPLSYFEKMLPTVRRLVRKLLEMDVAPVFDCNYIPSCLLTEDDKKLFSQHPSTMRRSNLFTAKPICSPVLDILPDLHVVRCFGMSSVYKAWLPDFSTTEELKRHFIMQVDSVAHQILPSEKCRGCKEYLRIQCSGGCYAYRQKAVMEARSLLHQQFGGVV